MQISRVQLWCWYSLPKIDPHEQQEEQVHHMDHVLSDHPESDHKKVPTLTSMTHESRDVGFDV